MEEAYIFHLSSTPPNAMSSEKHVNTCHPHMCVLWGGAGKGQIYSSMVRDEVSVSLSEQGDSPQVVQ